MIGHSSCLVRASGKLILCDPVWRDHRPYENFLTFPSQVNCDDILPQIEACTVSHGHLDHWTPEILEDLPCFVHIMDGRPRLVSTLADHSPVVEVPRRKWVDLCDGVDIFFVDHPTNTVDSACIIRGTDITVYVGSDCFLDKNRCMAIANATQIIDVACIPYSFVHHYPALIEMDASRKNEEARRLKKQSLDQARMFVETVRPKVVVPFGNNLLYCEGPDHPLNAYLAKPEELYNALPMNAGDFLLKQNGIMIPHQFPVDEKSEWRPLPPMDFKVELSDAEHVSIIERVRKAAKNAPGHAIVVNDVVVIDCDARRAYAGTMEGILRDKKVHRFYFDAPVFHQWASGSITFESALGSRRFKYSRSPDEYSVVISEFWANFL